MKEQKIYNEEVPEKIEIFEEVCQSLTKRINRSLDKEEKKTMAFVVERKYYTLKTSESLLKQMFGVSQIDRPIEICLKIHFVLNQLLKTDYRHIYFGFFPEETDSLRKYREDKYHQLVAFTQSTFSYAEQAYLFDEESIPLFGVQDFLLPKWFIQYSQQFNL
jgi:hypothetical protein